MFRIVYWYEDGYDAEQDGMGETTIRAASAEAAIEQFHDEYGCSYTIQCVNEVQK